MLEGERLDRVNVKKDADEDDSQDHVELVLTEDPAGIIRCLERQIESARRKVGRADVPDIPDYVDEVGPRQTVAFLVDQPVRDLRIECLDARSPPLVVQLRVYVLPLIGVQVRVARERKAATTVTHQPRQALMPGDFVLGLVLKNVLRPAVRRDVDPLGNGGRPVEVEVLDPAEVGKNLLRLARHYMMD